MFIELILDVNDVIKVSLTLLQLDSISGNCTRNMFLYPLTKLAIILRLFAKSFISRSLWMNWGFLRSPLILKEMVLMYGLIKTLGLFINAMLNICILICPETLKFLNVSLSYIGFRNSTRNLFLNNGTLPLLINARLNLSLLFLRNV